MSIGCDPEMWLRNPRTRQFIPALDKIGGSKDEPKKVVAGSVQEDGVALEIGIDAAETEQQFVDNINVVMDQARRMVDAHNLVIDVSPVAKFTEKALQDKRAWVSGCDPDYNAWDKVKNPTFEFKDTLRYGAGHIHLGNDKIPEHPNHVIMSVMACDLLIGVPSVILDNEKRRRLTYGRAGTFRPKPYGVEYRTPSNFWLKSKNLMRWIFNQAHFVTERFEDLAHVAKEQQVAIRRAIDTSDVDTAKNLVRVYNIVMP